MRSSKPLPATLADLIKGADISQRELVRRLQKDGWGSNYTITLLLKGEMRPTMHAMESIAKAFAATPEVFAEYRLGQARAEMDPDKVSLRRALKNLDRYEAGQGATGRDRALEAASKKALGQGRGASPARRRGGKAAGS